MNNQEKVFQIMRKKGMDIAVLVDPANIKFISGFEVPFWSAWMGDVSEGLPMVTAVIHAKKKSVQLIASDMYKSKIQRTRFSDTSYFRSFTHLEVNDVSKNYEDVLDRALKESMDDHECLVVGIEENYIPQCTVSIIKKRMPKCTFESATQIFKDARYIKTEQDLVGLREAARVADAAQEKLYEIAQNEGRYTELDIWFEVQKAVSHAAGTLVPFVGELVTGPNTALSDYPLGPTVRNVEPGDCCIMDISPRVNGYWADCSNSVVFWKKPNEEQYRYFHAVKEAFNVGMEAIYPGRSFREVNEIMKKVYEQHGMNFCSYQGHQIGCNVNEKPRFTYVDEAIIEKDMVLCIEPQMYTGKQGKTGIRLERMLHVTANGAVALNKFQWGIQ